MRSSRQVVMVAAVLSASMVATPYLRAQGATPLAGTSVDRIGIVVRDIDKTSQAFREIFGAVVPPARELDPMVLRGRMAASKTSRLKFTGFAMGGIAFELMQPIVGPSPHREFLDTFGTGMQHVGFLVKEPQKGIDFLVARGGEWLNGQHVNMKDAVGLTAEMKWPATPAAPQSAANASPLSGATIAHVGIVARDIDKTGQQFSDVFGITVPRAAEVGPLPFPANAPADATSTRLKYSQFAIGQMTFELLQQTAGHGPLRDHVEKFGQGLHHLSFTLKDPKAGIDYLVARGGTWTMAPYVDMRDVLGFTVEILAPR